MGILQFNSKKNENRNEIIENKSVAEIIIYHFEKMGVSHVFGIPGGFISPFLKLLRKSKKISFIIGRQETGTAFMADGYYRVTGKLGIVLVTSGPGAFNVLNGIACAHKGQSSVMLISGQNPTSHFGKGGLQESTNDGVNIVEIFRHACGSSELVFNINVFRTRFLQALRKCLGKPGQAAHLSIPIDIASTKIDKLDLPATKSSYYLSLPKSDASRLHIAFDQLILANYPLIIVGSGSRNALRNDKRLKDLENLLNNYGIPIATSVQGKGIFPENHEMSLGVYGLCGSKQSDKYIEETQPDVLMVIGSSLGEWVVKNLNSSWISNTKLFQIDINPENIGKVYTPEIGIIGDSENCIDELINYGQTLMQDSIYKQNQSRFMQRKDHVDVLKKTTCRYSNPEKRGSEKTPLLPQYLMKELNEKIPPNTSIFIDNGNSISWGVHYLEINPPTEIFLSLTVSSMGWSNGAVIGAKIGSPERTCICITGDGSFLMNGSEISTAANYKIGAIWIVLFDNFLGLVNHGECITGNNEFSIDDTYYGLGNPDLVGYATSLGADSCLIEKPDQLAGIFSKVLENANQNKKPQVLICKIDHKEPPPFIDRFNILKQSGA